MLRTITASVSKPPRPTNSTTLYSLRQRRSLLSSTKAIYASSVIDHEAMNAEVERLTTQHFFPWQLSPDNMGLQRHFKFRSFKTTWTFMNVVIDEARIRKHHPEWSNIYNKVFLRCTTHSPRGLSRKDLALARFCDERAREMGEVELKPVAEAESRAKGDEKLRGLVDELDERSP